ncbi:MAG: PIN domain-containing protein [Alcaligenaceae bacterium]|nr:PIN domain-containing protein [Alcaligenaceae bacterium]
MNTLLDANVDIAFIFGDERAYEPVSGSPGPSLPARAQAAGISVQPLPGILVLDTCVLLSNVLRRVLLRLAAQGCFIPVWSTRIGEEWQRNAARIWGVPAVDVAAQWAALQQAFPHADQGDVSLYENGLQRSDPKDWHVIAAGRSAKGRHPGLAAGIVTRNTKDFNRTELRGYGLALFEPDDLLVRLRAAFPEPMQALMPEIPFFAATPGHAPADLETILKRERLFRLNRLYRSAC